MNIKVFEKKISLADRLEIQKAYYLGYFSCVICGESDFTVDDLAAHFLQLDFAQPNKGRLKSKMQKSPLFIKGHRAGSFKLHASARSKIEVEFPSLHQDAEEVVFGDSILPSALFMGQRGFIERLGQQINACYENNLFDACAVMMRRLLEVCLILSYEELGITGEIKDSNGDYKQLNYIVEHARNNAVLNLSRNTKSCVNEFRTIGNFSAHKIYYNAKRPDIKKVAIEYRAAIEELLYKSGVLK